MFYYYENKFMTIKILKISPVYLLKVTQDANFRNTELSFSW